MYVLVKKNKWTEALHPITGDPTLSETRVPLHSLSI